MQLVIVQGESATGKTTLATRLAKDLSYSTCFKDAFKEKTFDKMGHAPSVIEWVQLENASWRELYRNIEEAIATNRSLIIEGNFKSEQRSAIRQLLRSDTSVVEIFCFAKGFIPFKRYVERYHSDERHKGHRDHLWSIFILGNILLSKIGIAIYKPLKLSNNLIKVDTTDFDKINYKLVLDYVIKHNG